MTNRTRLFLAPLLPFLSSLSLVACTGASSGPETESNSSAGTSDSSGTSGTSSTGQGSTGGSGSTNVTTTGTGGQTSNTVAPNTGSTGGTGASTTSNSSAPTSGTTSAPTSGNTSDSVTADSSGTTSGTTGSETVSGETSSGSTADPDPDVLTVQLQEVKQIIRGFGINATIMPSGETLPWEQLFTLEGENALGLSILRIGMNENGGHREVPSDWATVKTLGARVIGSCWSAPPDWKDNNQTHVNGGGHLLPERYADWATRIADYANENGLYAMSVGNETDFASCDPDQGSPCNPPLTDPYASMVYTGKELADFVKVAGPIFEERAPDTLMIAPEASLWIHVWSNLSPDGEGIPGAGYKSSDPLDCNCFANVPDDAAAIATCAPHCTIGAAGELAEGGYDYGHWLAQDEDAWNAFDILGVHEYETQVAYAWPADVTGGVRTKEVWQTEMSGVMYWPEQGPSIDIDNGIAVARWIHSALTVGEASAWLYWWYEAYYQNDNEGLALLKNRDGVSNPTGIAKRYYTMGNFSRYIRPDVFHAVRVAGPSPADVMVSAYLGDNGEVVIVAINETGAAVDLPIAITGGTVPAMMVPHVTSASENWAEGAPVAVADGSLPAALPPMSVTTFVSQ